MATLESISKMLEVEEAKEVTGVRLRYQQKKDKLKLHYDAIGKMVDLEIGADSLLEFAAKYGSWNLFSNTFYVNDDVEEKLQKIRDIVGNLKKDDVQPMPGKRKMVYVYLRTEDERFSGLRFRYPRKLQKSDPCQIVTRTTRERVMVCEKS